MGMWLLGNCMIRGSFRASPLFLLYIEPSIATVLLLHSEEAWFEKSAEKPYSTLTLASEWIKLDVE